MSEARANELRAMRAEYEAYERGNLYPTPWADVFSSEAAELQALESAAQKPENDTMSEQEKDAAHWESEAARLHREHDRLAGEYARALNTANRIGALMAAAHEKAEMAHAKAERARLLERAGKADATLNRRDA